jgi:hypothetical protein
MTSTPATGVSGDLGIAVFIGLRLCLIGYARCPAKTGELQTFAAVGYNFRSMLAWLGLFCEFFFATIGTANPSHNQPVVARMSFFTGDYNETRGPSPQLNSGLPNQTSEGYPWPPEQTQSVVSKPCRSISVGGG